MTIADYFQTPEAQRFLLIEITRNNANATKYYLADDQYITEPTDTPANTPYTAVIGGTGISDIRRVLNDPFTGQASTGFGEIMLVDKSVWTDDNGTLGETYIQLVRGATVNAYMAAPPYLFNRTDAIQILTGKIGRVGSNSRGETRFEVVDGSFEIQNAIVEVTDKPLCFGYCRNITPALLDPSLLEYYVHDGAIEEVVAVYDQGAALTVTTDYTVDLSTGKITLNVSPTGVLTADVKGAKPSGTWLDSTEEISAELISRAGVTITQNYDIPSGVIGLYITESQPLGALLNRLMASLAGYWLVGVGGEFYARQYPVPAGSTAVASFEASEQLGELTSQGEDRLYSRVNYTYRTNWTQYQSRGAASAAQADFSQRQYLQDFEDSISPDAELVYQESPQIQTLFDSQADAQAVAQRLLSIYEVQRSLIDVELPYTTTLFLGDNISIVYQDEIMIGAIVSIVDIFDGSYPTQKVRVLV